MCEIKSSKRTVLRVKELLCTLLCWVCVSLSLSLSYYHSPLFALSFFSMKSNSHNGRNGKEERLLWWKVEWNRTGNEQYVAANFKCA